MAKGIARIFEIMPEPLITRDQIKILNYDNVVSGKYETNFDLGLDANRKFEIEIEKYSYNWKSGGQYSKKKISNNN